MRDRNRATVARIESTVDASGVYAAYNEAYGSALEETRCQLTALMLDSDDLPSHPAFVMADGRRVETVVDLVACAAGDAVRAQPEAYAALRNRMDDAELVQMVVHDVVRDLLMAVSTSAFDRATESTETHMTLERPAGISGC